MADQDKAQKLAAAKRRVEQMKKKKSNVKNETNSSDATTKLSPSREIPNSFEKSRTDEASTGDSKANDSISGGNNKQEAAVSYTSEPDFPSSPKILVPDLPASTSLDISTPHSLTQGKDGYLESSQKEDISNETHNLNIEGIISTQSVDEPSSPFKIEGSCISEIQTEHRSQLEALKKENAKLEKECIALQTRLVKVEAESDDLHLELKMLRSRYTQKVEDKDFEQMKNESDIKFTKKIKELEEEIFELRREIQSSPKIIPSHENLPGVVSSGAKFTDVDLGAYSSTRRNSSFSANGGFGKLISNSFRVITGTSNGLNEVRALEDELLDFDEDAFRLAKEEEAKQRIERIKNIKRALKEWEGWRLNLADARCNFRDVASPVFEI